MYGLAKGVTPDFFIQRLVVCCVINHGEDCNFDELNNCIRCLYEPKHVMKLECNRKIDERV